ncbi:MAG: hypothetical protein IKM28_09615 [Lachnospiraceae bacterium]|nr:hypothetical protein [Lachnospiraceae bacterium]
MAEILLIISTSSFVLAALFLALAIFFWFKFGIPAIIGDLSGRTAKKSIAQMRENNEKSGVKTYRSSRINITGNRMNDKLKMTGNPESKNFATQGKEKPQTESFEGTAILKDTMADASMGTAILDETRTESTVGTGDLNEIMTGPSTGPLLEYVKPPITKTVITAGWKMVEDIMLIHTNEVIN